MDVATTSPPYLAPPPTQESQIGARGCGARTKPTKFARLSIPIALRFGRRPTFVYRSTGGSMTSRQERAGETSCLCFISCNPLPTTPSALRCWGCCGRMGKGAKEQRSKGAKGQERPVTSSRDVLARLTGRRGSHKSPLCERYLGTWPIHGVPVLYAKGTLPSICSERVSAGLAVE